MNNSLNVLSDSLDVKIEVLEKLLGLTNSQKRIFEDDSPDLEEFDTLFDEKDVLIDKLESLDEGFDELYKRVSDQLKENRMQFADQIRQLQDKISRITELSASIQAQEVRNKKMIEESFAKERQGIKQNRVSSKAAYDYYRNMSGMNLQSSGVWDSKN
ncbi:MAG: flagellar export chaperone FlgN [Lachnospiraceae bacterium]|nr:flagellar export chaperone FlgN [Lachnospiraceae bacterium]